MKFLLISFTVFGPLLCYANSVQDEPVKIDHTILGNVKEKPLNAGRSLVAVNEQSQEKSSARFFGPPGYGLVPGYGGAGHFPGGFGGYPGGFGGYSGGYGGYPGGFGGYPAYGGFGGYPGGHGYPGAGAFAGQSGYGYGLQQQQQLQGGGYASGAFAG